MASPDYQRIVSTGDVLELPVIPRWGAQPMGVDLVDPPDQANLVEATGSTWNLNGLPCGQWIRFDPQAPLPPNLANSRRQLERALEGEERTHHRQFAKLWRLSDEVLLAHAARVGPLGAGWKAIEYAEPPEGRSLDHEGFSTRNVFRPATKGAAEAVTGAAVGAKRPETVMLADLRNVTYEPVLLWRAESAMVAWLGALQDLARLPGRGQTLSREERDRLAERIRILRRTAHMSAYFLKWHPYGEHHVVVRLTEPLFQGRVRRPVGAFGAEYAFGPFLARCALGDALTGQLQAEMGRLLAFALDRLFTVASVHIKLASEWQDPPRKLALTPAANTALGALYAGVTLEGIGPSKVVRACAAAGCALTVPPERRKYCSGACAHRAAQARYARNHPCHRRGSRDALAA